MFLSAAAPVLTAPPINVTVLDGKDAIINCRALGAPVPNITWIYRGKFLFNLKIQKKLEARKFRKNCVTCNRWDLSKKFVVSFIM